MRILIFIGLKIVEVCAVALGIAAAVAAGMPICFLIKGRWTPPEAILWLPVAAVGVITLMCICAAGCGLYCLIAANWRRAGEIAARFSEGKVKRWMKGRVVEVAPGRYKAQMRRGGLGCLLGWVNMTRIDPRIGASGVTHPPIVYYKTIEEAEKALRECMDRQNFRPRVVRLVHSGLILALAALVLVAGCVNGGFYPR